MKDPDKIQRELIGVCRNNFNISIVSEVTVHEVDGKPIVLAYIPESKPREKPVFIKSKGVERGSFRRLGSGDYRCTEEDLDYIFQLRSSRPYEEEIPPGISWSDIEPDAVATYRRRRALVEPNASELNCTDEELLVSLRCAESIRGELKPNVAGLMLFGKRTALRRLKPMGSRIDYIVTEGPEWVGDPKARHVSIEYREALVTLLPRLHVQIMSDLPKKFSLKPGALERDEIPALPRCYPRGASKRTHASRF